MDDTIELLSEAPVPRARYSLSKYCCFKRDDSNNENSDSVEQIPLVIKERTGIGTSIKIQTNHIDTQENYSQTDHERTIETESGASKEYDVNCTMTYNSSGIDVMTQTSKHDFDVKPQTPDEIKEILIKAHSSISEERSEVRTSIVTQTNLTEFQEQSSQTEYHDTIGTQPCTSKRCDVKCTMTDNSPGMDCATQTSKHDLDFQPQTTDELRASLIEAHNIQTLPDTENEKHKAIKENRDTQKGKLIKKLDESLGEELKTSIIESTLAGDFLSIGHHLDDL